ncbi:hydroxyacylglutathione hydrolase [bacterium]|nr:hydroxyacylglutathione hydrolase [bacterium]
MIRVLILPFNDNYIYAIENRKSVCIIDPASPKPVLKLLQNNNLSLKMILNTHHHCDHTAGNLILKDQFHCQIIGASKKIPGVDKIISDRDTLYFEDLKIHIISTPGHTLDSVCYYIPGDPGFLFSGDTLFVGGCGRLFEGTADQMWDSLKKLTALPDDTLLYCGHEYSLENINFALSLDPHQAVIQQRKEELRNLLNQNQSSMPSTLHIEKLTNIFLLAESGHQFSKLRRSKDLY